MGNKTNNYKNLPVTEKKTITGSNNKLNFVICEMQGWRDYMVRFVNFVRKMLL